MNRMKMNIIQRVVNVLFSVQLLKDTNNAKFSGNFSTKFIIDIMIIFVLKIDVILATDILMVFVSHCYHAGYQHTMMVAIYLISVMTTTLSIWVKVG